MFLKKMLFRARREEKVIELIREQVTLLCSACDIFKRALAHQDRGLMRDIDDLERQGDIIRRDIIALIYEGAFLPYLRPDLCRFVEIVDDIFDILEDTAQHSLEISVPPQLVQECVRVALLNQRMCEMLRLTFEATVAGEDLREKTLAVRIYEKKIDDIKFALLKEARKVEVRSYWEGECLSQFLAGLTGVSDVIEDATDHLQIISVSMR